jgi:hypothetical protein
MSMEYGCQSCDKLRNELNAVLMMIGKHVIYQIKFNDWVEDCVQELRKQNPGSTYIPPPPKRPT